MSKDINTASSQSTENLGKKMPDNDKKITNPKKGSKKNTVIINPVLSNKPNDEPVTYDVLDNPINEAKALTALQRMHRGQVMRRIAPKLKRAREQAQHRIAGEGKLSERAMRHARNIIRDRLTGRSGVKYAEMDYASKQRIDKMLETKVAAIKRLALRLVPNERRTEQQRHSSFTHKDMVDNTVHKKAEIVVEAVASKTGGYAQQLATQMDAHTGPRDHDAPSHVVNRSPRAPRGHLKHSIQHNPVYKRVSAEKLKAAEDHVIRSKPKIKVNTSDGHKDAYVHGKHIVVDHGHGNFSVHSKSKYKPLDEAYDKTDGAADDKHTTRYKQEVILGRDGKRRVVNRAVKIKSVEEGLIKKSETTGIPLEALEEVYVRGLNTYNSTRYPSLTREQYAYGRVNKFVAESNSIDDDIKSRFRSNLRKDS